MRQAFYRRLWRFNAFVVAAVGVIGVLALVAVLAAFLLDARRRALNATDGPAPPAAETSSEVPALYNDQRIAGTPLLAITVGAKRRGGLADAVGSYTSDGSDQRNVLLLDVRNGDSRYILPNNTRRLIQWYVLSAGAPEDRSPAKAYLALVGDGGSAGFDVLLGSFVTNKQAWVARGVSAIDPPQLVDDSSVGLLVWNGVRLSYHVYGLADLAEKVSRPVPVVLAKP